jgi:hypothetical protein
VKLRVKGAELDGGAVVRVVEAPEEAVARFGGEAEENGVVVC